MKIKKAGLLLLIILLVLVLGACGRKGPSDEECMAAWKQIDWETIVQQSFKGETTMEGGFEKFVDYVNELVDMLLNKEHSPDSVGYTLKACIENGWDWREMLEIMEEEIYE